MYLKSPRRRHEKIYCANALEKRKNNFNNAGSGGRGGSYPTMLSCVQAAAEKETQKPWFWEQVKEHRCVPKIASPEARKKNIKKMH